MRSMQTTTPSAARVAATVAQSAQNVLADTSNVSAIFKDHLIGGIVRDLRVLLKNGLISDVEQAMTVIRQQLSAPEPSSTPSTLASRAETLRDAITAPGLPSRAKSLLSGNSEIASTSIRLSQSANDVVDQAMDAITKQAPPPYTPNAKTVVCTRAFSSNEPGDLNLRIGDMVEGVEDVDENWYRGTLQGVVGIFPKTFVEVRQQSARPVPPTSARPASVLEQAQALAQTQVSQVKHIQQKAQPALWAAQRAAASAPPLPTRSFSSSSLGSQLVTVAPTGWFYIQSRANKNVFDVEGNSRSPGALINVYPQRTPNPTHPTAGANQLFRFDNGYILNKNSNLVLDIRNNTFASGAQVVQSDRREGAETQLWILGQDGSIRNVARPQFVLLEDMGNVVIWEDDGTLGSGAMVWNFVSAVSTQPKVGTTWGSAPVPQPAPAAPSKGQQRSDAFKDNVASSAGHGMGLGFGATIGSGVARAILPF